MTAMSHLPGMEWDFPDQLRHVDLAGGGEADHVVRATGQRVRKVIEKNGGALIEERPLSGWLRDLRCRDGIRDGHARTRNAAHMDDQQRLALVETSTQGDEPGVPAQLCAISSAMASVHLAGAG